MYITPPAPYQFLYPFGNFEKTDLNQVICLWWNAHFPEQKSCQSFLIKTTNILNEPLNKYLVDTTMVKLPIEAPDETLTVIQLSDESERKFAKEIGFHINEENYMVTPCRQQIAQTFS